MNEKTPVRFSRQRECILIVLKGTDTHPTASWVYERVKNEISNISLGTVYRNLARLSEDGVILRISGDDGVERYDARVKPHYHMLCRLCGGVSDVFIDYADELDRSAEELCGCKIDEHRLMFYGVCNKCCKK